MTWCPGYLEAQFHLDKITIGWLMMFPFLGVVLGSLLGGLLVDQVLRWTGSKRWSRQGVTIGTSAIGVVLFLAVYVIPLGVYPAVALLFFAALFSSGGDSCSYAVSIDIGGRYMAVVFGAMNMMGNLGATVFPLIAVMWMRQFQEPSIVLLLALIYFIGMVCWIFVDPEGTIEDRKEERI